MGHDIHFLERLSRVGQTELELALSLYQDSGLVKSVLERAKIPDGAERIALALSDRVDGPHLVLARDGGFVTCLGGGMSTGPHHVVSRAQFDSIAARHELLRERLAMVDKFSGGDESKGHKLLSRIVKAGHGLTREEFIGINHFRPLLLANFIKVLPDLSSLIKRHIETIRHIDRPHPDHEEALLHYWRMVWAFGHLTLIIHRDHDETMEHLVTSIGAANLLGTPTRMLYDFGIGGPFLHSVWSIARVSRMALPGIKADVRRATTANWMFSSLLNLTAIGHRQARYRAETLKLLEQMRSYVPEGLATDHAEAVVEARRPMVEACIATFDDEDDGKARLDKYSREIWGWSLQEVSPESELGKKTAEVATNDERMAVLMNHPYLAFAEPTGMSPYYMLQMIPWLVRQEPESFYVPEGQSIVGKVFRQEWLLHHLEDYRRVTKRAPKRSEAKQSRNELCACGSGKKFKRCHGA